MARITIEDCMEKVPNRFGLVLMAAVRTKQLMRGARSLVGQGENRAVVTSLREVAAGLIQSEAAEADADVAQREAEAAAAAEAAEAAEE